jgi:hypothetical protein
MFCKQVVQGRGAEPVRLGAVHAGGPEVADLLFVAALWRMCLSGLFVDIADLRA